MIDCHHRSGTRTKENFNSEHFNGARFVAPLKCQGSRLTSACVSTAGEAGGHQPDPAEEREGVGLPGRPPGRGGPLQRVDRGAGPTGRAPSQSSLTRPRKRCCGCRVLGRGRQPNRQSTQCQVRKGRTAEQRLPPSASVRPRSGAKTQTSS